MCYAVEKQQSRYDQLCAGLAQYPKANVQPLLGSFLDHLDHILHDIGSAPAVFFLDPFGLKGSSLGELRPLLRRADTEIILVFNSFRLAKLAGFEDSNAKEAAKKRRLVSMILNEDPGDPNPEWIQKYRQLADERAWTDWAVSKYTSELIKASHRNLNYGLAYPVRKRFQGRPTYHLIYATRSTAGLPVMNDLICAEEDALFDGVWNQRDGYEGSLFPTFREEDTKIRALGLKDEILGLGIANQRINRNDLIVNMVIRRPGEFKTKHYRQVILQLEKEGKAIFAGKETNRDKGLRAITFQR